MKTLELCSLELTELNTSEHENINGGAGWYPGMNEAGAAVGKAFWGAVGEFVDGFTKGFNDAHK